MDGPPAYRLLGTNEAFDGLRGVAVLCVVLVHTTHLLVARAADTVAPGGFLGVDVFFVLSGFLITALLLGEQVRRGRIRFGAFWRRRALRLLPALFVLVAAHVAYASLTGLNMRQEWSKVTYILTYMLNWRRQLDGGEGLGHLWSLAVEEQFYIVWPLVVAWLLPVRRTRVAVTVILMGAVAAIAVHRALLWRSGEPWLWLYMRTDTRADSLLIGALLASLWVRGLVVPRAWLSACAWVAAVVLVISVLTVHEERPFLYLGGFDLIAVASAAVILASLERAWAGTRLLELPVLRLVGRVSYGLYLWHLPVFTVVQRYGAAWSDWLRVAVAFSVTALLTAASWVLVERPCLRWKDRLERRVPAETPALSRAVGD